MQPEEERDDTALKAALDAIDVVTRADLPTCSWSQPFLQPCPNIAVVPQGWNGALPPGGLLCLEHYNWYFANLWESWWNRGPLSMMLP